MSAICVYFVTILLSGLNTATCKCRTTASIFEEELRSFDKKPVFNFTLYGLKADVLYDKGDVMNFNCTDNNESLKVNTTIQEVQSATSLDPATLDGSTDNSTQLNTYALVYNNIFGQQDEIAAPSSIVPVKISSNITSKEDKTHTPTNTTMSGVDTTTRRGLTGIEHSTDDIHYSSASINSTHPNTYVLVFKNIFDRQDESATPSSNVPIQVPANATLEESKTINSTDMITLLQTTTESISELDKIVGNNTLDQNNNTSEGIVQNSVLDASHSNDPVTILLGEKHGITIIDVINPRNSTFLNKTDINAFAVDYKYSTNTIFFGRNGEIRSTGEPSLVVAGVDGPVRLAVDWVHDRLYWLSDIHQTVESASLDGTNRKVLADVITGIAFPHNIAVDPYDESIFFAANNSMYRAGLDGSNLRRFNLQDRTVRCLALDVPSQRLFFSGKFKGRPYIASCDYDGRDVRFHDIGDADWTDVFSLDVFRNVVYFAHYNPKEQDSVWAFNVTWVGKRPVKVYEAPAERGGIWSIKVFHSEVQKQSDKRRE
ncbi:uncharacterized protein LOC129005129 [Macrosteles quadrilineatus]|uniref:uncharacterized protein LOC129005129 n=1 Tax=Macrosteles quadrilineatus TaxID=74068 RepID=UPI0023E2D31F|nr:uncharacterized protein LOC129005129 [Macrosteles quadrilineatus]